MKMWEAELHLKKDDMSRVLYGVGKLMFDDEVLKSVRDFELELVHHDVHLPPELESVMPPSFSRHFRGRKTALVYKINIKIVHNMLTRVGNHRGRRSRTPRGPPPSFFSVCLFMKIMDILFSS